VKKIYFLLILLLCPIWLYFHQQDKPNRAIYDYDWGIGINWAMAATAVDSFGEWTATGDYPENYTYAHFFRFTTGSNADTITDIRFETPEGTGGTIKLAIYTAQTIVHPYPYEKVWGDNTGVSAVTGWTSVATDRVVIEAETEYWLAYKASFTSDIHYKDTGLSYQHRWRSLSGDWPASYSDAGWTSYNTNAYNIKGIYVYITGAPPAGQVIIIH